MSAPFTMTPKQWLAVGLLTAGLVVVYWEMFVRLIDAWVGDGNYSHGWLIMPIAAYFVWERRDRLAALPVKASWLGLMVFAGGLALLIVGFLGAELFTTRVSLIITLVGMIAFLFGWAHVRALAFPLAFLLLMIPLHAIIFNRIAFPLQLLASRFGEACISAASIPVLREGNVLVLANTSLEVAEACSGIRSLVSLITLGLVFGYFADDRLWVRTLIVLSTIPVAIVANGARVAGTGILAHFYGPSAAEGFFHEFSGWVVFIAAFLMILGLQKVIARFAPATPKRVPTPA
jgi:exosortase